MDPASAHPAPGIASLARFLFHYRHLIWIEARLFALALAILYVGAHGALRRPHSAAPPPDPHTDNDTDNKKARARRRRRRDRDRALRRESLRASDALLLPVVAALALVGLYYLMQYLQDPALLNRVLRAYMSLAAVAALGKLLGDGLHTAASVVFPNVWTGPSGDAGTTATTTLYRVDPLQRQQLRQCTATGDDDDGGKTAAWTADPTRTSPFPDRLAGWLRLAGAGATPRAAWTLRRLATTPWTVRVALRGVGRVRVGGLTLPSLLGPPLAAGVAFAYHALGVLPGALGNLIALGLCYGGLVMVSCTSFGIGSLLLLGLFVYDIVMVFYTPFMVTVATKLDAPMKLVASSGNRASLLGLGDIVVPGLFVCLCLRYDLYRHYARQIRHVDTLLETETETRTAAPGVAATTTTVTITTAVRAVKAPYIDPQGRWGDLLWTRGAATAATTPGLRAVRFAKPYFYTALAAYTVGLLLAIGAMLATGRGQPALLYLVPTLVGATWARALWAGELGALWAYTEDGSEDVVDVVVDVVTGGGAAKEEKDKVDDGHSGDDDEADDEADDEDGYDVFTFAIQAPGAADMEAVVI